MQITTEQIASSIETLVPDNGSRKAILEILLEATDQAVVVSQSQNEIDEFKKKGMDIAPHRKRMVSEDLDTNFKDPDHPLRIAFVCAMWMTGFDAPSCSTIYLDKPMRNHTLMQTIARANRVFPNKPNGLIVDYIGVFRNLQQALAIYGSGSGDDGETPVKDKSKLVEQLTGAIAKIQAFCEEKGITPSAIKQAEAFQRIALLDQAVEALLESDETKRTYLALANDVNTLFKAILPDPAANQQATDRALYKALADKIRSLSPEVDIDELRDNIEALLDDSIAPDGYTIPETDSDDLIDLSRIDFDALKAQFAQGKQRQQAERLKGAINAKLRRMISQNSTHGQRREGSITTDAQAMQTRAMLFAQISGWSEKIG